MSLKAFRGLFQTTYVVNLDNKDKEITNLIGLPILASNTPTSLGRPYVLCTGVADDPVPVEMQLVKHETSPKQTPTMTFSSSYVRM